MPTPNSPTSSSTPPAKRQRTQLACLSCRGRKTRCDGGRPACDSCERRGKTDSCVYDQAAARSTRALLNQERRYVAALEDRVRRLQRAKGQQPLCSARNSAAATRLTEAPSVEFNEGSQTPRRSETIFGSSHSPGAEFPRQVDALATVMSPEDDDACFYGASSTIAFLRHVTDTDQGDQGSTSILNGTNVHKYSSSGDNQPIALLPLKVCHERDLAVLPIRHRTDRFLACYWDFVHPLFPLLQRPSFIARYERFWLPNQTLSMGVEDMVFMSNLNLTLAIGCQLCKDIESNEQLAMADQFFDRSQHVLRYDILGSTSLSVVQWLLLTAIYCQSTKHASRCWNSLGLAIRLAQSLGLHIEHPTREAKCQVKFEMRRRLWHTCVVLDRLLAMTFGRPFMIGASYSTPIPSMIDDEHLQETGAGIQPPDVPSRMGLFVSSCRLFEIVADILSSFYARNDDSKLNTGACVQEMFADVLDFNRRLDEFSASIPDYLKVSRNSRPIPSDNPGHINLQQQVLYCR
ncbi:fungal-specific transcription factor domain-containing protein [Dactylonectria macrodidyma]|uniref:Fungal-specific transcription factor domain-containing protein n=1 Tax=Dactylonectria macrodidyma TaxID=307937 RepID=A0A9P9DM86_9HYPO|nr:fungal-specific transcription factor domain-containing protein [Dactylonectria macrodidyma]